jgi:hypothetical protein
MVARAGRNPYSWHLRSFPVEVNRFAADAEVRIGNSALSILLPTMSQPRAVKTLARRPRLISCEIVPALWPVWRINGWRLDSPRRSWLLSLPSGWFYQNELILLHDPVKQRILARKTLL